MRKPDAVKEYVYCRKSEHFRKRELKYNTVEEKYNDEKCEVKTN